MKTILSLLLTVCAWSAGAQSFANYKFSNFVYVAPGIYTATTNVTVNSNVLARVLSMGATPNIVDATFNMQYPGAPAFTIDLATAPNFLGVPVMGPLTVTINAISTNNVNAFGMCLMQFDIVNTSASPSGVMVDPYGFSASVALQMSTNLTTWSTLTNASFAKTNGNRFFRMQMTMP